MHWPVLLLASLFEGVIPLLVIRSESYTRPLYVALLAATVICSIAGLRYATRRIPLSIAYLVWTALGIIGTALVGVILLGETLSFVEQGSLAVIIIAVAGLRVAESQNGAPQH